MEPMLTQITTVGQSLLGGAWPVVWNLAKIVARRSRRCCCALRT